MNPLPSDGVSMSANPLDIDAVLYELALARGSAGWPTPTPTTRLTRPARVTKPGSAGNSPQRQQQQRRRRTSASHKTAKYRSELYPLTPTTTTGPTSVPATTSSTTSTPVRPVSWHPSTMGPQYAANGRPTSYPHPYGDPSPPHHRLSLGDFQTVDINGMPTPLVQPDLRADAPLDWGFRLDGSTMAAPSYLDAYASPTPTTITSGIPDGFLYHYPPATTTAGMPSAYPLAALAPAPAAATFSPSALPVWSTGPPASYASLAFTAPPTPDILPIQQPSDPLAGAVSAFSSPVSAASDLEDDGEPELVSMGLYDEGPAPASFLFDGMSDASQLSPPTGKGLKLEETWEPPPPSEDDAEDDGMADFDDSDAHTAALASSPPAASSASPATTALPADSLGFVSPATTLDQPELAMPIQHPEAARAYSTVTTVGLAMPIQHPDVYVSKAAFAMPIQRPDTLVVTGSPGTADFAPDLSGQSFFIDRDVEAAGARDPSAQLWLQAMLAHGLQSALG